MFTIVRLCVKTSLYLICQKSFYIHHKTKNLKNLILQNWSAVEFLMILSEKSLIYVQT